MTVTELPVHAAADPALRPDRWQPTRAGILNVWRYFEEVFRFHRGRLLLRGPNGSGKSKALELLLPYLFDASLRASRLSTFGGSERTMHWNLMSDGYGLTTRVGYVWLEFGRTGAGGSPEWFTCGARLSASTNSRHVEPTYFTTGQRVGLPDGLSLVKDGNVPLTRADLVAALGAAGAVHSTPGRYRRAVRETLFRGVTEEQYEALIATLLQLRTPKLSEHLDPDSLSEVLSKALPPIDQQDLAEIAEGFEKLDRRRERLQRLDQEVAAAGRLADRQRRYARRVLRRAAAELVSATTQLDNVTRDARASRAEHDRVVADLGAVTGRLGAIDGEQHGTEQAILGLQDSDAYKQGRELDRLREQTRSAAVAADRARGAAVRRATDAVRDEQDVGARREDEAVAAAAAARSGQETGQLALRAGLGAAVQPLGDEPVERARTLLRGMVTTREHQLGEVRQALDRHERAVQVRTGADGRLATRRGDAEAAAAALAERDAERDTALAELREAVAGWAGGCRELPLRDRVADLVDLAADEQLLLDVVADLAASVREAIAGDQARLRAERDTVRARREPLVAEKQRLHREETVAPAPPPYRTADRTDRPGAPLWRLLDWRPGVDERHQARVEAALEAAGLLDAWVRPDGTVDVDVDAAGSASGGHDTYLAAALAAPAPGGTLLDVLAVESGPDREGGVPGAAVHALLRGVGYGATAAGHPVAVGADGSWRLGPAYGSWDKPDAAYIGATARERTRQRRLAELAAAIADLDAALRRIAEDLGVLDGRREAVDAELAARPPHRALRAADEAVRQAAHRMASLRDLVAEAERELAEAEAAVRAAVRALTLLASRHGLPTVGADLDQLAEALRTLRNAAESWLADRSRQEAAASRRADAADRADRSRALAEEAADTADTVQQAADGLTARLGAVERSIGAEYRAVLDEVDRLRRHAAALKDETRALGTRRDALHRLVGELTTAVRRAEEDRGRATDTRDEAVRGLTRLAGLVGGEGAVRTDLGALGPVTATLQVARQLAEELASTPYESRHLKSDEAQLADLLHDIRESLAGYADLSMEPDELCDVQVVSALVDGLPTAPSQLVARLSAERDETAAQLTEEERRLFDRTLTGDTRRQVADRIRQADALVRQTSTQLEQVRTVSGLRVRLVWEVDPELAASLRQARDLLLRDPARLSAEERDALHDFFRARIDEVRTAGTAEGWEQQLTQVLDYRRWHRFVVQMRGPGGEWVTVTRRQHGAKSGGEKAIVLHLPLFAAAAAHYRAAPSAPRLILLDEVFIGVDQVNRGQLLDVLAAFDLDLMLTSDQEWCTYPELDGIAIHQMITGAEDGDDAVTTARFVWTGTRLRPADAEDGPDPEPDRGPDPAPDRGPDRPAGP